MDANAFVQKSLLAQTLRQFVETEFDRVENLRIRFEGYFRPALSCLSGLLEIGDADAAFVLLFVSLAVAPYFDVEPFRKKVNY